MDLSKFTIAVNKVFLFTDAPVFNYMNAHRCAGDASGLSDYMQLQAHYFMMNLRINDLLQLLCLKSYFYVGIHSFICIICVRPILM